MFTGLVEAQGVVSSVTGGGNGGVRLSLSADLKERVCLGDSVALNGVCLTVSAIEENTMVFDILGNTLKKSNLSEISAGHKVNIETALRVGDKLGGHFVTGHIDGMRVVKNSGKRSEGWFVEIFKGEEDGKYLIPRGSIAIDGVSLTVAEVEQRFFRVYIVPHTFERTTLSRLKPGSTVNIEFDMMAKYANTNVAPKNNLTMEQLRRSGFMDEIG